MPGSTPGFICNSMSMILLVCGAVRSTWAADLSAAVAGCRALGLRPLTAPTYPAHLADLEAAQGGLQWTGRADTRPFEAYMESKKCTVSKGHINELSI